MPGESAPSSAPAKVFVALFGAAFATLLGAGIVVPLLPVYARHHGASGLAVGMIFAAFSLTRTSLLPYFGRLSDRKGRRRLILIGLLLYAACTVLYNLSRSPYDLILARLIQGAAAAMVWPIAAAYVGDLTPSGREGTYMGRFNLATFSGLAAGPVLGGLINDMAGIQAAFISMGVLALVGFFLAFWLLPGQETFRPKPTSRPGGTLSLLKAHRTLRGIFLFRCISTACISLNWSFQPILLDSVAGLSSGWIGLLISLNVATAAALQTPMGSLADRVSRVKLIQIGALIQAGALCALPLSRSFPALLAVNLAMGLGGGISLPSVQAIATDLGRSARIMGTVMGVLFTGQSLGMLMGPLLAGFLYEHGGLNLIFWTGGVLALVSLVPVWLYLKPDREATSSYDP
jgi:MFS family permease